jgi:hypothetical protein
MNMELQMTTATVTETTVVPAAKKNSVLFPAVFRLALLVGPEAIIMKTMSHSPVMMLLAGFAVLALWLSVDIGPFRAAGAPKRQKKASQPAGKYARNLTKAQWWSYLFCRLVIVVALLHSRTNI